jgi:glycine/D-amino acid oxidase-like deaminating enzyme
MNHSPWIEELDNKLNFPKLQQNIITQKLIIGGGIAGVCTAYFLLKYSNYKVMMIEAGRIGHGASGHNAGQVVQYFEKPFSQITKDYCVEKAIDAQKSVFFGWELLESILKEIDSNIMFETFVGYSGVMSLRQLINHLENKFIRDANGIEYDKIYIDRNWDQKHLIPSKFLGLIQEVDTEFISNKIDSSSYFPILLSSKKGCINSALLCQKLIKHIQFKYANRIAIFEQSPVNQIKFFPDKEPEVSVGQNQIVANDIILCTNGFENLTIIDLNQDNTHQTNHDFHKHIEGLIGYMVGYKSPYKPPTAISYFVPELTDSVGTESYYYLSRRSIELHKSSLICVGVPELYVSNTNHYIVESHNPKKAYLQIRQFLKKYRINTLPKTFDYHWHGLMGFTKSGLRYIGKHPHTPHLWYNLGCNGVGILTSIYGGWKSAQMLNGTDFRESVFDPT